MTTAEITGPRGALRAITWARDQRAHRQLPRAEGDVLQTVATFSDPDGVCRPGVERIAAALGLSRRHAHRLLHRLESRGLMLTERRGRQPAVRRLRLELAPVEQLVFDVDQDACTATEPVIDEAPNVTPTSHQESAQCDTPRTFNGTSRCPTKNQEEDLTEGRDARETGISSVTGLSETLQETLDILATAKQATLMIEPLAVNAALQAFPQDAGHDHRQAAYEVVAWTWDAAGPPSTLSANRLLMSALRKQTRSQAPAAPGRDGRPGRFERRPVPSSHGERDFSRFRRSAGW